MNTIIIYTKNNCPACERAKHALFVQGKAFMTVNVDHDFDAMDYIVDQGIRTMPAIFIDGVYSGNTVPTL